LKGTKVAHHKSAKKRILTNEAKRTKNRQYLSSVRTAVKKFITAADKSEGAETLTQLFKSAQSALAKAGSKGMLHKNNVSRKIARLTKRLAGGTAAAPEAAAAPKAKAATKKKAPAKKKTSSAKSGAKKVTKKATKAKKK
jgi:small subunit ribosomal protein S20